MTDRVRGYPAFPKGQRRARTWWGRAWLQAVEDTSLDQGQMRLGRKFAAAGIVGTITVSPGRLAAVVYDTEDTYRTSVSLTPLSDAEWTRFLAQVTAKAGHIAALLDGDMPHDLVVAADDAGVQLLPGIGDLDPDCTCPGWELPCRHAAALCNQASWLLDADPWVLLLLRGREREELLAEIHLDDDRPATATGELATEVFAAPRVPLPAPPPLVELGPLPEFDPVPDVDVEALRWLVADAAARARELLTTGELPVLEEWPDRVRMACTVADPRLTARLAAAGPGLPRAMRAWGYGGAVALTLLDTAWAPSKAEAARAHTAWEGEELPPATVWRNHWTVESEGLQLRLGHDGRWYPYRREGTDWWPAGPPERDPAAAFADLMP
ncbi:SWIM zinc finger family protein [Umezawaea sp. Da 62-37]|uniref:SWIM zinc finger family protein n=1 Tax=Umezawaea sp. Da 62-37 TaxID=3075927 RepID=UPI0028F70141|nr:SWIM zinc finger family protein [Umezawaea sp. Da 62-37]WNV86493.1 SWIM zinc finger family protein [Umezawaea sp. Da 62-37]